MSGTLYIISTPIGNLKDITLRAIETLREVDFVACEDTRVTSFLLNHFEIKKELISVNAHNENNKVDYLLSRIEGGENGALVSDAGTPGISDPGVRLTSGAVKREIKIVPIPGASAVLTALTLSGFPTDSFVFEGFPPQKKGRQKLLQKLSEDERTVILYESVFRIEKLLKEIELYMPERHIVVCRELTKMFEDVWRGTASEIIKNLDTKNFKGEFTVVIAAKYFHL